MDELNGRDDDRDIDTDATDDDVIDDRDITDDDITDDDLDDESDDADDADDDRPLRSGDPKLRRLIAIAAVLSVFAIGAIAFVITRDDGALPEDAVMRVEGETITEEGFARRIELLSALYGVQIPDADSEDFDAFRRDSAKSVAVGLLLTRAAVERGVEVADRTASDSLARYIEQQYPVGGRDEFIRQLGNAGATEAEVLEEFRRTLVTQALFNDVVDAVSVSEEDLRSEYEARLDELAFAESRRLRHLVVSTEEAATAARARIDAGEDFAAVASEISLDGATAAQGGDLGVVTADVLDPAFGGPAFDAAAGEVFGPIQTDLGWYVGKVDEVIAARTPPFEEIADALRARITLERELEQWRVFLEALIADADVDYADDYRPDDPDAPPPVVLPDPLSAPTTGPATTGVPSTDVPPTEAQPGG